MDETLQKKVELFVENNEIMKGQFGFQDSRMRMVCANIYSNQGKKVNVSKIKECIYIIKTNTGLFSNFKGTAKIALATMLSLEEDPNIAFGKIQSIYEKLRENFNSSDYLPVVAFLIGQLNDEDSLEYTIRKAKCIYERMKREHRFLTSSEDVTYAVLFALSAIPEDRAITEMEHCYRNLKTVFRSSNAVQSLSHVLALDEFVSTEEKCQKVFDMFALLKRKKNKFDTGYELAILGVLALSSDNIEKAVDDIIEVSTFLKPIKGFGDWSIGRGTRLMFAAMLVESSYTNHKHPAMGTAALNSMTSLIIAEEAAMCACMAASAAAAASANS